MRGVDWNGSNIISYCDTNNNEITRTLFKVSQEDVKHYNMIWEQGLDWSTLLLPIKYRPEIEFEERNYERAFTTDIAIGPFFGYKRQMGKFYDQYLKIGIFAGPSLINYSEVITEIESDKPNTEANTPANISNQNLVGYSFGWGIVYQFNKIQIGLINGKDYLGGDISSKWQYNGENWYSFAIGYKFSN